MTIQNNTAHNTAEENYIEDKVLTCVNKILVQVVPKEDLIKRIIRLKNKLDNCEYTETDITEEDIILYIFTKPMIYRLPAMGEFGTEHNNDLTIDETFMVYVYAFDRIGEAYPWLKDTAEDMKYKFCTSTSF